MFKYHGVNLIKTVYRPYLPLMSSLFYVGFSDPKRWKKFIGFSYHLQDAIEIEGVYYYPDYHLNDFAKKATKHVLKNKANFLYLKNETLRREKLALRDIKNKKISTLSIFLKNYIEYQPTLSLYHICDDFIEDALKEELLKKTNADEVKALMSHLNLPLKFNLDQLAKRELLKTGDISYFIKNHSWNFSRYGQYNPLTIKQAKQLLISLKRDKNFLNDSNRVETKKAIKRAKQLLKDKGYYVDVMQFFIYYRTHRTDIFNKIFYSWYDTLTQFAENLGLSYDDLIHCSYPEIINNKIPSSKILAARKNDFVACLSRGKIDIYSGDKINVFKKLIIDKNNDQIISGRSAFPGIIRGEVKIISGPQDMENFKSGCILVASMTTPSMVIIMKKAAAFITDEGGITCHASILAREMKTPCVIGTKIATRVLHNGDLVEVDANQGVVKIIKRK
jgi:phosphohistidine swiveling domain-containing protein